ncbi:hypothetical protein OEA41_009652 [Lepraria neglecta]|uniref:Asl1-like glycosyl hydrolase catalytic domain-containing protein n=1 Tax=Lepraria neglecta TaxID=209136 RepID=A0AAD9Z2P3_9LECA|nr:hypothetical protein OEA41_009652 [Lepraria neglecta]
MSSFQLWGDGHLGDTSSDADRLAAFKSIISTPPYMMGFYEPDWTPPDSSNISPTSAASTWSTLLAPLGTKGTILGSPSLATQKDESWLTPFENASEHPTWDYTCIHTNKPNVTGVMEDVEYYLGKYKKPIWVSEFACVDDVTWAPYVDADEIKMFIQEVVAFLQGNESVVAYGYSNGDGLGDVWSMIDSTTGAITASGQGYLDAIHALH